jgi:hypothetical protein
MAPIRVTTETLDRMRQIGDPEADEIVRRALDGGAVADLRSAFVTLGDSATTPALPEPFAALAGPGWPASGGAARPGGPTAREIRRGQRLFERLGPEILMVMGFYSIPAAFAAANGVKVLHRSGYFRRDGLRRVWETAQFVVDIMTEAGLAAGGAGLAGIGRVRLLHACIRRQLRHDPGHPWDDARFGVPINQEDMAGTLMEFSTIVLDGLVRMGVALRPLDQRAYLAAWRRVGRLMGIDPALIPATLAEARELTALIARRQIRESAEGRELTAAMIRSIQDGMPDLFDAFVPSTMRFFLERSPFCDGDVPAMLGIPTSGRWRQAVIPLLGRVAHLLWYLPSARGRLIARFIRRKKVEYLRLLMARNLGGARTGLQIAPPLAKVWKIPA